MHGSLNLQNENEAIVNHAITLTKLTVIILIIKFTSFLFKFFLHGVYKHY